MLLGDERLAWTSMWSYTCQIHFCVVDHVWKDSVWGAAPLKLTLDKTLDPYGRAYRHLRPSWLTERYTNTCEHLERREGRANHGMILEKSFVER
jgi:hypothetical protein